MLTTKARTVPGSAFGTHMKKSSVRTGALRLLCFHWKCTDLTIGVMPAIIFTSTRVCSTLTARFAVILEKVLGESGCTTLKTRVCIATWTCAVPVWRRLQIQTSSESRYRRVPERLADIDGHVALLA